MVSGTATYKGGKEGGADGHGDGFGRSRILIPSETRC